MTRRKDIIFRIAAVEREFRAAALAVSALQERVRRDPGTIGTVAVTPADVRNCAANLEATYLVRMFAVFEEALRDVWASAFARRTRPKTVDLLDGCAAHQHVADRDRVTHTGCASTGTICYTARRRNP